MGGGLLTAQLGELSWDPLWEAYRYVPVEDWRCLLRSKGDPHAPAPPEASWVVGELGLF